jgi:hypothetical protein
LVLFFTIPDIISLIIKSSDQVLLLPNALPLSGKTKLSGSEMMKSTFVDMSNNKLVSPKMNYNQNYAFSMWIYLNKYDNGIKRQQRNIFNYGNEGFSGKPCIYTQSSQVYVGVSNVDSDESTLPIEFPAQKWNFIVVNYRYNEIDLFVNGELVKTVRNGAIHPIYSAEDVVVIGDDRGGISGSICNIAYHKHPLTKVQISSFYNFLHLFNPPIIPSYSASLSISPSPSTAT